jgi:hypothetical protein
LKELKAYFIKSMKNSLFILLLFTTFFSCQQKEKVKFQSKKNLEIVYSIPLKKHLILMFNLSSEYCSQTWWRNNSTKSISYFYLNCNSLQKNEPHSGCVPDSIFLDKKRKNDFFTIKIENPIWDSLVYLEVKNYMLKSGLRPKIDSSKFLGEKRIYEIRKTEKIGNYLLNFIFQNTENPDSIWFRNCMKTFESIRFVK